MRTAVPATEPMFKDQPITTLLNGPARNLAPRAVVC